MWRLRIVILAVLISCLFVSGYQAQETPQRVYKVAFIEEGRHGLNTASSTNIGDDGLTRLKDLFVSYNAQVRSIDLESEIDEQYQLLVLISPKRALSVQQTVYLWDFLQRGGHLLLALDPYGHNGTNSERSRSSGISQLLYDEYGISVVDDFWIEPWFSIGSLSDLVTSWSEASAENFVPNPITEPLVKYDLPIRFWGGRSIFVDGLTGISNTNALIYSERPYGETERINLRNPQGGQFIFNIGDDNQGHLILGAVAENYDTGSRVALIGDGEIFQNLYGQTRISGTNDAPRYPGDYILTQRLVAWLLGIPEEEWPPIPNTFTWLALDGDTSDWSPDIPETTNLISDMEASGYAIQKVRAFHNDQFLYLAVESPGKMPDDAEISLQFNHNDTLININLVGGTANLVSDTNTLEPIGDAAYVISDNAEIRLPLRIVGTKPLLNQICVSGLAGSQPNCIDQAISSTHVNTIDPVPMRFSSGPSAMSINTANIHSEANTDSQTIAQVPARTLFSVVGRSEDGKWLLVRNGRYEGWVAEFLVSVNAEIGPLPVVSN